MWVIETRLFMYGPFRTIKEAVAWGEKELHMAQCKYIKLKKS